MEHSDLKAPLTVLRGVGPQLAQTLEKLGWYVIEDLLFHLPIRYQDRTRITSIGQLRLYQHVLIDAEIRSCKVTFGRRRSLVCRVQDNTGSISFRLFHFSKSQQNQLQEGKRIRCFGETRRGATGIELYHPEYRIYDPNETEPAVEESLTPVYPATEGVSQARIRSLITQVFEKFRASPLTDFLQAKYLPEDMGNDRELFGILEYLHLPPKNADLAAIHEFSHPFQLRLAFEELVAHHLSLVRQRERFKENETAAMPVDQALQKIFLDNLPFSLTAAQQKVASEISNDMNIDSPMLRLVQGDVGSGKTVVAAMAALQGITSGYQAALMAPTEILAEQHFQNFSQWFATLGIEVGFLSGSQTAAQKRKQLENLASGKTQLVVGTHALYQQGVEFHKLGLVIVDEQHRFGVQQRYSLLEKGHYPHQLIMTATPIPRTLAMSMYADLDCSVIDELPPGRTPVNTVLIDSSRRDEVIERVYHNCNEGKQVYWVCTLIEESEELECEAAEDTAKQLAQKLPGLRVGLLHGRMKAKEKEQVMAQFKQHELDLLVATTVIEVGVDVPNASLMIIENPERLGLAQLHQLRGRVGRGEIESFCVLLYANPLSQDGKERLAVMRQTSDGFVIAEKDLELRGPGEVLGVRQTGDVSFHIADLQRDAWMLDQVQQSAAMLMKDSPGAVDGLVRRWLGSREKYARA
jgi:ATP-dependent DNA helicase RecG